MKFGHLEDISNVNFDLPAEHHANRFVNKGEGFNFYYGAPLWGDKSFVGKLYPPKTKASDYLYYYSRQFTSIELNSSYYRIPSVEQVTKWAALTPIDFKFCPKLPQIFSQRNDLGIDHAMQGVFFEMLYAFEQRLGPVFLQLPPSFSVEKRGALIRYLSQWPKDAKLAVEFRHTSWFEEENFEAISKELNDMGICLVITDTAGVREVLHSRVINDMVFVRFTGNSLHPTDFSRIDQWVARLQLWIEKGLKDIYFFAHQPEEILCANIAIDLITKLNKNLFINLPMPSFRENEGEQGNLF
ncbi:DUF72 domain-containing protein [Fulvivirgaceae bacterium LMO-SS25]